MDVASVVVEVVDWVVFTVTEYGTSMGVPV
jgi:hypothetical protein